jgi:hypothetical protein
LGLKPLPKIFDYNVADQRGNDGDDKIGDYENVSEGRQQALFVFAILPLIFSHQEIRIKQKNYKSSLNHCSPEWRQSFHSTPLRSGRFPSFQHVHSLAVTTASVAASSYWKRFS